jgi:hypothetical protein
MYFRRVLIGLVLVLVTASCVSAEKKTDGDDDGETDNPYVVKDRKLETSDLTTSLKSGKKVLVIFDDFEVNGNPVRCPVKVRTVDDVCQQTQFGNSDASVVCRNPGDGNPDTDDPTQRIKWKSNDAADTFKIEILPSGYEPCEKNWTGGTFKKRHNCRLKTGKGMGIGSSGGTFVKYNVVGSNTACPPLDPYFIVRK